MLRTAVPKIPHTSLVANYIHGGRRWKCRHRFWGHPPDARYSSSPKSRKSGWIREYRTDSLTVCIICIPPVVSLLMTPFSYHAYKTTEQAPAAHTLAVCDGRNLNLSAKPACGLGLVHASWVFALSYENAMGLLGLVVLPLSQTQ